CQAREAASSLCPGVGEHPAADPEEGLDRAAAPDDAARREGPRFEMGLTVLLALVSWAGMEAYGHLRSAALVESLRTASTSDVPPLTQQFSGSRRWADPRLVQLLQETQNSSREHLHASLALLPGDSTQVNTLYDRLIAAAPAELPVLRDALEPYRSELAPRLWS